LNAGGVSVLLLDEERNELYFPYVSEENPEAAQRLRDMRVPAGSGLAGAALLSGQAEKIDDPQSDPRFYSGADKKTGVTTKSLLVAPLIAEHERLGVIEAVNPHGRTCFSDADLGLLKKLAVSIAVADPIFGSLAPGVGDIPRTPGREKNRRHGRAGLSTLWAERCWPLRQNGSQRDRIRHHGRIRRRDKRAACRERGQTKTCG
jgi:hypothetical protein